MNQRNWHTHFQTIAFIVAQRSTCLSRQVGAVAVKDNNILATGYNGSPKTLPHCTETQICLRKHLNLLSGTHHELCHGVHAEQNLIIQAAKHGINLNNAIIYCTHQPCYICLKMLINLNVDTIYFSFPYPDPFAEKLLEQLNFQLIQIDKPTLSI